MQANCHVNSELMLIQAALHHIPVHVSDYYCGGSSYIGRLFNRCFGAFHADNLLVHV